SKQEEQRAPQAVEIGAAINMVRVARLLRSDVIRRANNLAHHRQPRHGLFAARTIDARQTEIKDLYDGSSACLCPGRLRLVGQEQIAWLDVAVNQPTGMTRFEADRRLPDVLARLCHAKRPGA